MNNRLMDQRKIPVRTTQPGKGPEAAVCQPLSPADYSPREPLIGSLLAFYLTASFSIHPQGLGWAVALPLRPAADISVLLTSILLYLLKTEFVHDLNHFLSLSS